MSLCSFVNAFLPGLPLLPVLGGRGGPTDLLAPIGLSVGFSFSFWTPFGGSAPFTPFTGNPCLSNRFLAVALMVSFLAASSGSAIKNNILSQVFKRVAWVSAVTGSSVKRVTKFVPSEGFILIGTRSSILLSFGIGGFRTNALPVSVTVTSGSAFPEKKRKHE